MGRPRKYATQAEAAEAKAAAQAKSNQQRYQRQKDTNSLPRYIAYMPVPSNVPSITPPNLQLRSDCLDKDSQLEVETVADPIVLLVLRVDLCYHGDLLAILRRVRIRSCIWF